MAQPLSAASLLQPQHDKYPNLLFFLCPPPPCSSHTSISFFSTPQSFHPTIFHSLMSHHIVVLPLSLCLLHHLLSSCHLWCAFCSVQLHCRLLEGKTGNKCTAVKGKALWTQCATIGRPVCSVGREDEWMCLCWYQLDAISLASSRSDKPHVN